MTEQRWKPIENGTNTLAGDGSSASVFGNRLVVGYENERVGVRLPDNIRLCRKVEELEAQLKRWEPVEDGTYNAQHCDDAIIVDRDYLALQEKGISGEHEATVGLPEGWALCKQVETPQPLATVVLEGELSMPVGEIGLLTDDRKTYIEIVELIGEFWVEPDWLARDGRYRITVTRVEERK